MTGPARDRPHGEHRSAGAHAADARSRSPAGRAMKIIESAIRSNRRNLIGQSSSNSMIENVLSDQLAVQAGRRVL